MDVLVLSSEHGLLHHPQEDDSPDPELKSEDLAPVEGAGNQPGQPQQHVDCAHDRVEREQRPVRDGEIALRVERGELEIDNKHRLRVLLTAELGLSMSTCTLYVKGEGGTLAQTLTTTRYTPSAGITY